MEVSKESFNKKRGPTNKNNNKINQNQTSQKRNPYNWAFILAVLILIIIIVIAIVIVVLRGKKSNEENKESQESQEEIVQKKDHYFIATYQTTNGGSLTLFNPARLGISENDYNVELLSRESSRRLAAIEVNYGVIIATVTGITKVKVNFRNPLENLDYMFFRMCRFNQCRFKSY